MQLILTLQITKRGGRSGNKKRITKLKNSKNYK